MVSVNDVHVLKGILQTQIKTSIEWIWCGVSGRLLGLVPYSKQPLPTVQESFELLGLKWLPGLSMQQAKELTPYEVGHKQWKSSIHTLSSGNF